MLSAGVVSCGHSGVAVRRAVADFSWSAIYRLAEWSAERMPAQRRGVDVSDLR